MLNVQLTCVTGNSYEASTTVLHSLTLTTLHNVLNNRKPLTCSDPLCFSRDITWGAYVSVRGFVVQWYARNSFVAVSTQSSVRSSCGHENVLMLGNNGLAGKYSYRALWRQNVDLKSPVDLRWHHNSPAKIGLYEESGLTSSVRLYNHILTNAL